MEELKKLIVVLGNVSDNEINGWDEMEKKLKEQDELMKQIETLRLEHNTPLGFVLRFPHADSYAYYIVSKVYRKNAIVSWINYCDGWQDDRLGEGGEISLKYITEKIKESMALKRLFS